MYILYPQGLCVIDPLLTPTIALPDTVLEIYTDIHMCLLLIARKGLKIIRGVPFIVTTLGTPHLDPSQPIPVNLHQYMYLVPVTRGLLVTTYLLSHSGSKVANPLKEAEAMELKFILLLLVINN